MEKERNIERIAKERESRDPREIRVEIVEEEKVQ